MADPYDDPDAFRMTLGDHLEELRRRLIYGLAGFAFAAVFCLLFGKQMISIFCKPLIDGLLASNVNPQLVMTEVSDGFMVYLEISMIVALVFAAPWIVWQLWQFVAAGLYPYERKTITRYVPLSIGLLIAGDLFVYFFVLPLTIKFFLVFGLSIPMRGCRDHAAKLRADSFDPGQSGSPAGTGHVVRLGTTAAEAGRRRKNSGRAVRTRESDHPADSAERLCRSGVELADRFCTQLPVAVGGAYVDEDQHR
jgi:hypothetical protein